MGSYGTITSPALSNAAAKRIPDSFNIPSSAIQPNSVAQESRAAASEINEEVSVGSLFILLEENKEILGLEFHSVSPSTLDEIFLKVVERHGVGEQDLTRTKRGWKEFWEWWKGLRT